MTPRDEVFQPLSESMLGARIVSDIPRQSGGMSSSTAVLAALLQAMPLLRSLQQGTGRGNGPPHHGSMVVLRDLRRIPGGR